MQLRGLLGTFLDLIRMIFDILGHYGTIDPLKDDPFPLADLNQTLKDLRNREMRFVRDPCGSYFICMPGGTLVKELQNLASAPGIDISGRRPGK
jgi:hypothetical protein